MRTHGVCVIAIACGCGSVANKTDAAVHDGPSDGATCVGVGISVCLDAPPTSPVTVTSTTTLGTSVASSCTAIVPQQLGPELCVVAGTSLMITGTLNVTGSRPLVLLATGDATISGTVDVSSHRTRSGPGA